jgi:hypothetical protein
VTLKKACWFSEPARFFFLGGSAFALGADAELEVLELAGLDSANLTTGEVDIGSPIEGAKRRSTSTAAAQRFADYSGGSFHKSHASSHLVFSSVCPAADNPLGAAGPCNHGSPP